MKKLFVFIALFQFACGASAGLIDFSLGSFTTSGDDYLIDTSYDATFSKNLYSHPDGFVFHNGGAYNFYGERGEYITFSGLVSLTSIDFSRVDFGFTSVDSMSVTVFDGSSTLIDTITFDLNDSLQTIAFELDNVAKVVFDWVGQGSNTYSDGRDHNWYFMDNIRYDTANNLYPSIDVPEDPSIDVPEPTSFALLGLGFVGMVFSRKKNLFKKFKS